MIKDRAKAKFDETVEVAMNLGVDPRHADQMVRGVCNLPNAPAAPSALACSRRCQSRRGESCGADVVGAEDLVEKCRAATSISTAASRPPI